MMEAEPQTPDVFEHSAQIPNDQSLSAASRQLSIRVAVLRFWQVFLSFSAQKKNKLLSSVM